MTRIQFYFYFVVFLGVFLATSSHLVFAAVTTDTMVGYWKLDEITSGEAVVDSSGDGNIGSTQGSAAPSTDVTTTIQFPNVRSRLFDGIDDYINIPDIASLRPENGSWTVSAWIKPENINQNRMIVGKRQNSGSFEQWSMWICGDGSCGTDGKMFAAFFIEDGSSVYRNANTTITAIDGNWHLYTMVANKSAGFMRLYIDGNLMPVTTNNSGVWPTVNNTDSVRIGNNNSSTYFKGGIDDVRVYNRALSTSEISDLAAGLHTQASWTGNSSNIYEVAANWDSGVIPDPYTRVTITSATDLTLLTENIALASLTINSGALLDLAGYNITYNDGGTLTNNGTLYTNGEPTSTSGVTASQNSNGGNSSATVCTDSAPIGKPDLFQIDANQNEVVLHFTTVKDANKYLIFYGTTPDVREFGDTLSYSGPEWVITRSIKNLKLGKTYYFKVQAARNCAGGEMSSTVSAMLRSGVPAAKSVPSQPTVTPTLKPIHIEEVTNEHVVTPTDIPTTSQGDYQIHTDLTQVKTWKDWLPWGVGAGVMGVLATCILIFRRRQSRK